MSGEPISKGSVTFASPELATKNVYEFALILEPLKLEGATGSTVAPIAVR